MEHFRSILSAFLEQYQISTYLVIPSEPKILRLVILNIYLARSWCHGLTDAGPVPGGRLIDANNITEHKLISHNTQHIPPIRPADYSADGVWQMFIVLRLRPCTT